MSDGALEIGTSEGWASFDLGAPAEKGADKIRHPRTLMDRPYSMGLNEPISRAVPGAPRSTGSRSGAPTLHCTVRPDYRGR